jgi:hypothetical protein
MTEMAKLKGDEAIRLFKYVPPQRADILLNEKIAFTRPANFPDRFEWRLCWSNAARKEFKRRLFKDAEKRAELELPGYRQLSSRQRKKGRKEQTRGVDIETIGHETFQATIQRESQRFGVLCLSTTEKNHLMWDRYANGFQGFVMEFDTNHDEFKKLGACWKVEYVSEPPAYDYSKPAPLFFRFKLKCYEYESEYRLVRPLCECLLEKNDRGDELFFRPLPRTCIKAVYLGHRMEKTIRENILGLLKDTIAQKFDVSPSSEGYKFSFRQI